MYCNFGSNQPASTGVKNCMKISGGGFSVRREPGGKLIFGGGFFESIFEQVGYRFVLQDFLNSGLV